MKLPPLPTLDKLTFTLSSDGTFYIVYGAGGCSGADSISGEIVIPAEYNGKPVKQIGDESSTEYSFANFKHITSVIIPNTVTKISGYSFYYCSSLESIIIPDSVIEIGSTAFSWCEKLKNVEFGNSIEIIGNGAFNSCTSLTEIKIPNCVTHINDRAFEHCSNIVSLYIGSGVKHIGKDAFACCNGSEMQYINVNTDNQTYKSDLNCLIEKTTNRLILGCNNSIIPDYVTEICEGAFTGCNNLKGMKFNKSIKRINDYSLCYCRNLQNAILDVKKDSLGTNGIFGSQNLKKIHVIDGNDFNDTDILGAEKIPVKIIPDKPTAVIGKMKIKSMKIL